MNIAQFIILSILFLVGIFCQVYNLLTELKKGDLTKLNFLLQISAILSSTIVYALGVIGTFTGIYKV